MSPHLPNFLVVGAQKAATTSLHRYLSQHPQIFMSTNKEPGYLIYDGTEQPLNGIGDREVSRFVSDKGSYLALFNEVREELAIGEASTAYLHRYMAAIPNIDTHLCNVKIIMVLRHPAERAYSAYYYLRRQLREPLSFEDGLLAEKERIANNWGFIWHYCSVGFYYEQVRAYLEHFGDVKVCLYDDFRKDPKSFVVSIFDFLEVDTAFMPDMTTRYNVSGIPRSTRLQRFIRWPSKRVRKIAKTILPESLGRRPWNALKKHNMTRPPMKQETREKLCGMYKEDIDKLQDLIGVDLTHWHR
jgi:hypothetical protein